MSGSYCISRRNAVAGALLLPGLLSAQQVHSSTTPIKLAVGYGPGGGTDLVARAVGDELSKVIDRTVLTENRPGANGAIAAKYVARSEPDGTNLLVMPSTSLVIDAILQPKIALDPDKELVLISALALMPLVIVVPASSPYENLADLMKAAKAANGAFTYGWGNLGMRICMEELSQKADVRMQPIGYKGAGQSVPAIVAGDINMLIIDMAPIAQLIKSGKVKALAVSTPERASILPNVPTFKEAGFDLNLTGSVALYGPAKMSPAAIKGLQQSLSVALKKPELRNKMANTGMDPYVGQHEDFVKFMAGRKESIANVIKAREITLE